MSNYTDDELQCDLEYSRLHDMGWERDQAHNRIVAHINDLNEQKRWLAEHVAYYYLLSLPKKSRPKFPREDPNFQRLVDAYLGSAEGEINR